MAERVTRRWRAARGVLFVHSVPRALCPHVEWSVGRVFDQAVNFQWAPQPALRDAMRTEFAWEGIQGDGARIASALLGWDQTRFEVTENPAPGSDGGRWLHTPRLGIFHAMTDTAGNFLIPEDRIRDAMAEGGIDVTVLHAKLRGALGQDWDDELEPFRHASDFAPVVWLHEVG